MSFIEGYGKDFGEVFEYDEAPVIAGSNGGKRTSACSSNSSRARATERLSSSRFPSEISMDLGDLQDALREEEDSNNIFTSGSMHSARSDGHASSLHQQLLSVEEDCSWKSDGDDDGDEFSNYRSDADVNDSTLKLDDTLDLFQQNGTSDFSSFYKFPNQQEDQQDYQLDDQQKPSTKSGEQGETGTESSKSMSTSSLMTSQESSSRNLSHSSKGSLNSRRKVKFEISTRLEDIQEFEKPDIEDYHKLYYTAHELQRMIDGHRAEELKKGRVVR